MSGFEACCQIPSEKGNVQINLLQWVYMSPRYIFRDILILAASVCLAVFLVKSNAVGDLVGISPKSAVAGSFIGGMMFTSFMTTAPGMVILAHSAKIISPFWVAAIGVFGALLADYLLFRIIRDYIAEDILTILRKRRLERFVLVLRNPKLRLSLGIIAALIIASPLPDELAITMLGLGHFKTRSFLLIAFCLHFLGILTTGVIGSSLLLR